MDNAFIDGLFVFAPRENTPSFVKAVISIRPDEFTKWLEANKGKVNDKGFLPIQILESKGGKWYAKVNDFKPTQTEHSVPTESNNSSDEIDPNSIPF